MKKFITVLVLVILSNKIFAQENMNWVDSILNKILLKKIVVYDQKFKPVKNYDIQIFQVDTVVSCQWTRPKFEDNIFQSSLDGGLYETQIIFDTSTNKINSNYIDFKVHQFDKEGNYLKDSIIFLIKEIESNNNATKKDIKSANILKNTKWLNHKIELDKKEIELDSCHDVYRLQLNEDFVFYQYYGNNQSNCITHDMNEEMEVGVEGYTEDFFKYHNKIQGHYINIQQGNWQIEKNELKLFDLYRKKVIAFEIEKLNNSELHLRLKGNKYKIIMKKASH